jgi:hypothetical protein
MKERLRKALNRAMAHELEQQTGRPIPVLALGIKLIDAGNVVLDMAQFVEDEAYDQGMQRRYPKRAFVLDTVGGFLVRGGRLLITPQSRS